MRLAVIGPPGSGKTTQAEMLAKKLSLPYISMGALLREAATKETKLGRQIKLVLEKGELVDDNLALNFFFKRVRQQDCQDGFVVEGPLRTFYQVTKIEEQVPPDKVVLVKVFSGVAKKRLLERGRVDDTEEAITRRLRIYEEAARPVLEFYRKEGRLIEVNGERPPDKIAAEIVRRLGDGDQD